MRRFGSDKLNLRFVRDAAYLGDRHVDATDLSKHPLRIGTSIGTSLGTGTLCCFALDEDGALFAMSCSHVVAGRPGAGRNPDARNMEVFHPGPNDLAPNRKRQFGSVDNYAYLQPAPDGAIECDSATIKLDENIACGGNALSEEDAARIPELSSREIGPPVSTAEMAKFVKVYKLGKSSGLTSGRVKAYGMDFFRLRMVLDGAKSPTTMRFHNVIEVEWPDGETFSAPGDSGSLLFAVIDGRPRAVGMVFAMASGASVKAPSAYTDSTLACSMAKALDFHNLSWLSDE